MINSKEIYLKANRLVRIHETRNPLKIAEELGIFIYYSDDFTKLLGMYSYSFKNRAIFLNNRMDEELTLMVSAHELGHDTLHREEAKNTTMKEFDLFNIKDPSEYEANAFAAHLLLDTEEFLDYVRMDYDIYQIARAMNVHVHLAFIKQKELIELGYNLKEPVEIRGDFFKNIEV